MFFFLRGDEIWPGVWPLGEPFGHLVVCQMSGGGTVETRRSRSVLRCSLQKPAGCCNSCARRLVVFKGLVQEFQKSMTFSICLLGHRKYKGQKVSRKVLRLILPQSKVDLY